MGKIKSLFFMHPGKDESVSDETGYVEWNNKKHNRKFLEAILENEQKIYFWGEWEPPSIKDKNTQIHRPVFIMPPAFQNTDPFVFGGIFLYTVCRQPRCKILRNLGKDSIIYFGSNIKRKFVLDTVFVVDDFINYKNEKELIIKLKEKSRDVPKEYFEITIRRIIDNKTEFRLYFGQMDKSKIPYSYIPCSYSAKIFERPVIRKKIVPAFVYVKEDRLRFWNEVLEIVKSDHLNIESKFAMPKHGQRMQNIAGKTNASRAC